MKIGFVHNPKAGQGKSSLDSVERLLRGAGYKPVALSLEDDLERRARQEECAFVAAAGGDGTLRQVALRLAGTGLPMAPLPAGTANNIGRAFGLGDDLEAIVRGWQGKTARKIDIGVARGPWGERRFVEGVGLGLVGRAIDIIEEMDAVIQREFSSPEDKLHRDLSVFIALAREMPSMPITVCLDGQLMQEDFLLLEILNIPHAGPRLELANRARPDDGKFDVVSATADQRLRLTENLMKRLSASHTGPAFELKTASELRLTLQGPGEIRIDDEVVARHLPTAGEAAHLQVDVRVEPGALHVLVP